MKRRIMSVALILATLSSISTPVLAVSQDGTSEVSLTIEAKEPEIIQFRVPSGIQLNMDADGNVTVLGDYSIENLSDAIDIEVTSLSVTGKDGWEVKSFDTDLESRPDGTTELAMQFRGDGTQDGGIVTLTDGNWSVAATDSLPLNIAVKIPKQSVEKEITKSIAQVNYTVSTIEEVSLQSISITKQPNKLEYQAGDNFDHTGMEVTAYYSDGTSNILNFGEYKVLDGDNLQAGQSSVTIQYTEDSIVKTVDILITTSGDIVGDSRILDKDKMRSVLQDLTGSIVFSTEAYDAEQHTGTATDISEAGDNSVIAVVNGQDAVVYADGGCYAPEDSSFLFGALNNHKVSSSTSESDGTHYKFSSADLHGLNTSRVTDMEYMFSYCYSLADIDLHEFDTANVENMYGMFSYCTALTNLDVSMFNTTNVKNMHGMFSSCTNLKEIDLSNFDTNNVETLYAMFYRCFSLVRLDLSTFSTPKLNNIRGMFQFCNDLEYLDLSGIDASKLNTSNDSMYEAFEFCTSLTTCYGRTQEDCNKLNSSRGKPSNVNFVVKH